MQEILKTGRLGKALCQVLIRLLLIFSSNPNSDGIVFFWNDEKLSVEPYDNIKKVYYCGRETLSFTHGKSLMYQILSFDYDEAAYAEVFSDGEIKIIWNIHSEVPHKMKAGGQSSARFARIRQNEITKWFKRINQRLMLVKGEIHIDVNDIYYKRFFNKLHTYNQQKIKCKVNSGYSGASGIYQAISCIESLRW